MSFQECISEYSEGAPTAVIMESSQIQGNALPVVK